MLSLIARREYYHNPMSILTCTDVAAPCVKGALSESLLLISSLVQMLSLTVRLESNSNCFPSHYKEWSVKGFDTRFDSNWDLCLFHLKSRMSEEGLTMRNLDPRKVRAFFGL